MAPQIAGDTAQVERYISELARFGAYGDTGVWRTVYSPEWVAATEQYAAWCEVAGLRVRRDAVGSVWGRLDGSAGGKAIVSGSHIDSQRPGGRYDGALGVLGALIAIRFLIIIFADCFVLLGYPVTGLHTSTLESQTW
jgi:allantoate deiminase